MKTPTLILAGLLFAGLGAHGAATLSTGHTDLGVVYEDGHLSMNIHADTTDTDYVPWRTILQVSGNARVTVPDNPLFAFLGRAGRSVWILPEVQDESLLFLGFGSDGLPTGVFSNDVVHIRLKRVHGPGDFALFAYDAFGAPSVVMNTRDHLTAADTYAFAAGSDAHFNWAFTQPGYYYLTFETTGTLPDGRVLSSGPVTYTFNVQRKVTLATGHTDLGIVYANGEFSMNVHADTTDTDYDPNFTILQVNGHARTTVPNDPAFSFLGRPGYPVWILPEVQDETLLFLGFGSDGLPTGVFSNDVVHVRLKRVIGPGNFTLFGYDSFGVPQVVMNTRDRLTVADTYDFAAGSDAHFNWAFSRPGTYYLTFETTGTLLDGTVISTGRVTYTIRVLRPVAAEL